MTLVIPGRELYNEEQNEFFTTKDTVLQLEHSLISISLWESKWHKAYLKRDDKRTLEETIDYVRCMTLNKGVDPNVYYNITDKEFDKILSYIENPMTATTINMRSNRPPSREIVTSELVYYWMIELGIPFDPCQKWHFNRLMTLIDVCNAKQSPGKNMSKRDIMKQNHALNQARKAKHGTRG